MDGRCKSLDGNKYAQIFANDKYFAKPYPLDTKSKAGDALKMFCRDYGIPEHLTFDGSKEQVNAGTTFMKTIRHYNVDHYISCLLYTSPSPRDTRSSRMPSSA